MVTPSTPPPRPAPQPRRAPRWITTDGFIMLGFWSQVLVLILLDWGTIVAMRKEIVPWYHYVGFVLMNAACVWAIVKVYKWLQPHQRRGAEGHDG